MFSVFGRYHSLSRLLEEVLLAAVFCNAETVRQRLRDKPPSAKFFFEQGTHFMEVRRLLDAKDDLEGDMYVTVQLALSSAGFVVSCTALSCCQRCAARTQGQNAGLHWQKGARREPDSEKVCFAARAGIML